MIKHVKSYKRDYPRPQFIRDEWMNLNGVWEFAFDDENIGEDNQWYKIFPKQLDINVPFVYQTQASSIDVQKEHQFIWYKKDIIFSRIQSQKKVLLHFEGSDYLTKVWINGNYVGCHRGGYTRFSFDITNYVNENANTITVKVEDTYNCCQPRGKQRWKDENFGCWYVDTTGIWKTIWCEFLDNYYLKNVKITPMYENFQVKFDCSINRLADALSLETIVSFNNEEISRNVTSVSRVNFSSVIDTTTDSEQFKMYAWSPTNPNLYDVEFILKKNNIVIDRVKSYFGFRKWDTSNKSINLNDESIYLKMILDQGYWKDSGITPPDEEAILHDIKRTLEMGFNGIRKHQKIEDERFYYYCDILGVIVWCEMPSAYEFKDETIMNLTDEWLKIVEQYYNHPCIMTWVPFNESWGVPRIRTNFAQQKFTEGIYYLTKAIDKTRFVVSNDGWEHTKSDIITLHNYTEYGDGLLDCYQNKNTLLDNGLILNPGPRHVFANGYNYEGQPIIISEYAGIAFLSDKEKGWGYGQKVKNKNEFIERLKSLTYAIREMKDVCGYCVTQTTDVEQEVNGLLTTNRESKVDIDTIKEINDYTY